MNRPVRIAGLVLAGLLVGLPVGAYLCGAYYARPARQFSALTTVAWAGQVAHMQYEGAGYDQAREALEGYIALLQQAVAKPEYDLVRTAHFDMGLTYTRLALLAEANGKPELVPALMARAVEEARAGGFKTPTPEGLRSFVQRVDRRVPPTPTPGA